MMDSKKRPNSFIPDYHRQNLRRLIFHISSMPCFSIFLLCPLEESKIINVLNDNYIRRHARELQGDIKTIDIINIHLVYEVTLCDENAADFLRDLLAPFFVGYIRYKYSLEMFYKNSRIQRPHIPPPRYNKMLKDIYWGAVQCERNRLNL